MNEGNYINIVFLSSLPWTFLWQRPQHIASKLAKKGHNIVYFDSPEYVSVGILLRKMRKNQSILIRKVNTNLSVVKIFLPEFRGVFSQVKNSVFERSLKSILSQQDFHPQVSVFYSLHFVPLLKPLQNMGSKIMYDCVDDALAFQEFATDKYRDAEIELIQSSSACIATSKMLCDKITQYNSKCTYLPNAMDFEHFNSAITLGPNGINPEVAALKHPVIGFIGAVYDWIDVDLVCKLAQVHPEYTVLLVGPVDYGKEKLEVYSNIIMVGAKPYESLPTYLAAIDVCLIPFKINNITLASNPIKMYEYLASGKPVVSTALPEVINNASKIVAIGESHSDFIDKVEKAVEQSTAENEEVINERLNFARQNSWNNRVDIIEKLLNDVVSG